jgi:hypothetical protein
MPERARIRARSTPASRSRILVAPGQPGTGDGERTWLADRVPVSDPWIRRAFERFDELALADGHLHGGRRDALTTPFLGRPAADVREPPGRLTHTASFAPRTSFPDDP